MCRKNGRHNKAFQKEGRGQRHRVPRGRCLRDLRLPSFSSMGEIKVVSRVTLAQQDGELPFLHILKK